LGVLWFHVPSEKPTYNVGLLIPTSIGALPPHLNLLGIVESFVPYLQFLAVRQIGTRLGLHWAMMRIHGAIAMSYDSHPCLYRTKHIGILLLGVFCVCGLLATGCAGSQIEPTQPPEDNRSDGPMSSKLATHLIPLGSPWATGEAPVAIVSGNE
jgi:hypothetical protein